jgi:hypothetical protein
VQKFEKEKQKRQEELEIKKRERQRQSRLIQAKLYEYQDKMTVDQLTAKE